MKIPKKELPLIGNSEESGHMGKYRRLISDTLIFAIGSLGSKMILFFLVPLYTNCLSTSQYGMVELVDTIANLIMPIVSMVIFDAVLRYTLDKNIENNSVILNACIVFFIGIILTLLITPLFGLYKSIYEWKWFVSLYVITYMATQISMTYIKAKEQSKLYVTLGLTQTLLLAVLNIILLVFFKLQIYGYLAANILAHLIVTIIAVIKGNIIPELKKAHFDKDLMIEMIKFSSPLIINNISWWVIQSSDKLMVEIFLQSAALGLYSVACKIPALINVVTSFFSQAWSISSIKEYDSSKDTRFYSQIFEVYAFVIFLFCSCLLMIIKEFMHIYVGEEFFEAWKFVPWLLVAASFSAISGYFGAVYGALKKSVNTMLSTLFSALINITLNFLLIQRIGVMGATVATAVAYLFIAVYRVIDTRRFFKFKINFKTLVIESFAVSGAAFFVTLDKWGHITSAISISIIMILNIKNIKMFWTKGHSFLRKDKKKI